MIDDKLAAFLEEGVGIHLGTRNATFQPNGARALSIRVERDRKHVVVYMAAVAATRVLPDLESNGLAAVVAARPTDDRACQVKGTFVSVRPVEDQEREAIRAQWNAFLNNLEYIGIPRIAAATWVDVADLAIRLKVTAVFEQTPGPEAGKALA